MLKTDCPEREYFTESILMYHVIVHQKRLDRSNIPEIFSGCDVIVEAFDNAEMKEMLIETVQTENAGNSTYCRIRYGRMGKNEYDKIQEN